MGKAGENEEERGRAGRVSVKQMGSVIKSRQYLVSTRCCLLFALIMLPCWAEIYE